MAREKLVTYCFVSKKYVQQNKSSLTDHSDSDNKSKVF